MPQPCTVCHHPQLEEINSALVSGIPRLRIARQFDLKEPAVRYHAGRHLPEHEGLVKRVEEATKADTLLEKAHQTVKRLESLIRKSEASEDWRTLLLAARELRPWLELLGKMTGGLEGDAPERDPHELAREAERYLEWYDRQFPDQGGESGGVGGSRDQEGHSPAAR